MRGSLVVAAFALCACRSKAVLAPADAGAVVGLQKIQQVVVIMQENRSFDHYFGTYPGADGIPLLPDGGFSPCAPDLDGGCIAPFHDTNDINAGGPHGSGSAIADINGGSMDGFVRQQLGAQKNCTNPNSPTCAGSERRDAMGFHDDHEIPNYWAYAKQFVLQDRMFEPNASWSLPQHLFMVSGWSALCSPDSSGRSASTPQPTAAPTRGPPCAKQWGGLAISRTTLTSLRRLARR